jgi:aminopeptidase N
VEESEATAAQYIIGLDSLESARAIHGAPNTSAEIKEMFDGFTYQKGAAVISMLEAYLGPETFRHGVNRYLEEHANGNATSADFWRAEAAVSGKPIDEIMPTFVMQPGVPIISIRSQACNADSTRLRFTQQRFYLSPKRTASTDQKWQIPVCIKTSDGKGSDCEVVSSKTQDVEIKACRSWFFANRNAKGYYRSFYEDPKNLTAVAAAAEKGLTPAERVALVEDVWAMTRAGKTPARVFLDLAHAMRSEQSRTVLDLLAGHLGALGSLAPKDLDNQYRAFVRAQFGPLAEQLGWNPRPQDSDEQKALRASLLGILGAAGDVQATSAARKVVQEYLEAPQSVEGTIAVAAFPVAAENGDAAFYERLIGVLDKSRSTDEYYQALFSLAEFRQPALLERTLNLLDQGKIRQQDYPRVFSELLANEASRDMAWSYLKAHWTDLSEKVTSFGGNGAVTALGNFCTPQLRDDVRKFFAHNRAPGAARALQQSLERMDRCIEFKQSQQASVTEWLRQQQSQVAK